MPELDDALAFFDQNYDLIGQWTLIAGERIVLGENERRWCRFCGRGAPEATFTNEAHAIPELLGNRSLFTNEECDDCNHFFGEGIENHLGNWSKPVRALTRIRGKSGIPTLKKGSGGGWRIEPSSGGLEIKDEDDPIHRVDDIAKTLTLQLTRDTYIPVEVLKAFVKIGITLLPAEELPNFDAAIAWLRQSEQRPGLILESFPILHTFRPGPVPDAIVAIMLRRKTGVDDVPYAFLVLSCGNEVYQVALPSPERDAHFAGKPVSLYYFPFPMPQLEPELAARVGPARRGRLDLTGREPVKGHELEVVLNFETAIERQPAEAQP